VPLSLSCTRYHSSGRAKNILLLALDATDQDFNKMDVSKITHRSIPLTVNVADMDFRPHLRFSHGSGSVKILFFVLELIFMVINIGFLDVSLHRGMERWMRNSIRISA